MDVAGKDLQGVTVALVDEVGSTAELEAAFVAAGAIVLLFQDFGSSRSSVEASIPDVAVISPGTINNHGLRALADYLVTKTGCVSILYDSQFPEQAYRDDDMIHRSRPVEDVVAAAISGVRKRNVFGQIGENRETFGEALSRAGFKSARLGKKKMSQGKRRETLKKWKPEATD